MSEHQLQIALDGVIELLAHSLYSDPDVFVRELLQNAHDAILKRRWSDENAPPGRILIAVTGERIVVEDNGVGLTETELHEHLSTIGRSGTASVREALQTHREVVSLIGQFGIGLLSTFLVASRVTVETCTEQGPPLRWVSGGGRSYRVEPGCRTVTGTTVTLDIKPSSARYLHPGLLKRIVTRYTDLLPVPVYVVPERRAPANRMRPPWEEAGTPVKIREAHRAWWRERFGCEPSVVFSVRCEVMLSGRRGRICGLLGYPAERVSDELPLDVYVSNVFITSRNRELLPAFAGPLCGIIGTEVLSPNAARDDVMADAARDMVRDALGMALLAQFTSTDPQVREDLLRALQSHTESLLPLLARLPDGVLLTLGKDLLLRTDRGAYGLGDVIDASPVAPDGVTEVHGSMEPDASSPQMLLCAARLVPIVKLTEPLAALLERYLPLVSARLVEIDRRETSSLLVPLRSAEHESYRALVSLCEEALAEEDCTVSVVRFAPAELVALRMDRVSRENGSTERSSTLYLNADCAMVQALRARANDPDDGIAFTAIRLIHAAALLISGQRLAPDVLHRSFTDTNRAIAMMLGLL